MLLKNPNYQGPRAQPFDAIAIKVDTAPADAIRQVQGGALDAAMLPALRPDLGTGQPDRRGMGPRERATRLRETSAGSVPLATR